MLYGIQRLAALHRLHEKADDGSGAGGGGGGDDATAVAAAKAAAEAEAARLALEAKEKGDNKPTDAEAKLLKELMAAKGKSKTLEDAAAAAAAALKAFDGIDPVKARELLAAQEEAARKQLEAKGDYERLTKQMGDAHTAESTVLKTQLAEKDTANAAMTKQIADLTVGAAFGSSKFVLEDMTLPPSKARALYGAHFEFKDGQVVGYDKPAGASERTVLVNAAGETLSFEDALKKLVNSDSDKEALLRTKAKSGAGSTTNPKGADKVPKTGEPELRGIEKIQAGLRAALANK